MRTEQGKEWQEFDPSTFTHLARFTPAVSGLLQEREQRGFPVVKRVLMLGSGLLQPFEIAADPRLEGAHVVAVDMNDKIVQMGEWIKGGNSVDWGNVADISVNPGRKNADLLLQERLKLGLSVLRDFGILSNLGGEFNVESMSVRSEVADRVSFIKKGALEALIDFGNSGDGFGLVLDGWMQVNINKKVQDGPSYSFGVVRESLNLLAKDGMYVIGDTGKNLPATLGHFARVSNGELFVASLTHCVNFGRGFASSHVLVGGRGEPPYGRVDEQTVNNMISANPVLSKLFFGSEPEEMSTFELSNTTVKFLNLVYLAGLRTAWNSKLAYPEALQQVVPSAGNQVSEDALFPAQKPYLR